MSVSKKKNNKQLPSLHTVLFALVIALIIIRVIILPFSPPGFYIDEAATGAHVVAMIQQGTDAHGQTWPLFSSSLGGGYTTPVYLYPLTVWAMIFGASETALRYFSEFITITSVIILALGVRYWFEKRGALITAIVGLALPWGWLQGSLAWDPVMVPLFVSLSFFAFSSLLFSTSRSLRLLTSLILPISLIALAYAYPPARVTAPLLYVTYYTILIYKKAISLRTIIPTIIGSCIISLPLLLFILTPEALSRASSLSIFYHTSVFDAIVQFVVNLFILINPIFLFFVGDFNLRHSTVIQGMLGLASLPAAFALVVYIVKHRHIRFSPTKNKMHLFVFVVIAGTLFGLIGSALTAEGQPHSLRAAAAWPFLAAIIGLGWYVILTSHRRALQYTAVSFFIVCTALYIIDFVAFYPTRARDSFDVPIRQELQAGNNTNYPSMVTDYYANKNLH